MKPCAITSLLIGVFITCEVGRAEGPPDAQRSVFWDLHCAANLDPTFEETNHPHLDGGFVGVPWNMIEPAPSGPGTPFDFSRVETHVSLWAAGGKRSILRTSIFGKNCVQDWPYWFPQWMAPASMPAWPFGDPGVFTCAKGEQDCVDVVAFLATESDTEVMALPRVWDSPQFLTIYDDYVAALAAEYDGDPRIASVWMGVGHGGYTTVNTTSGGNETLPGAEAGWTPALWKQYVFDVIDIYTKHFTQTPVFLSGSPKWTRDVKHDVIVVDMQDLFLYAVQNGASIFLNGLGTDQEEYQLSPFPEILDHLAVEPLPDDFILMLGDDWPMWVDEERRISQPFLSDRDENGFRCIVQTADLEWTRIGRRGELFLKVLRDEIEVSNPLIVDDYRSEVAAAFQEFDTGVLSDCNNNGLSDLCEDATDCNENLVPDECDLAAATSFDCNLNGRPDECDFIGEPFGGFSAPSTIDLAGLGAISVATGHFNDDAFLDMVVANENSNTVEVLLNDGTGEFTPVLAGPFSVGTQPHLVITAHLNADENLDVVTANRGSANISVLLGNGDGTLAPAVSVTVGNTPRAVVAGYLDGDNDLDLAVANWSDNNVCILLNDGFGTFSVGQIISVGTRPFHITAANLDEDTDLDLITANQNSDDVSVLLNIGGATFADAVSYPAGDGPRSVAACDLNGDGFPDLAVATRDDDMMVVLLNEGDGLGTFATAVGYPAGDQPRSVAAGDLDDDGRVDVVVANKASSDVSVFLNQGDGTFLAVDPAVAGSTPLSVAIGDFDGDGSLDVATTDSGVVPAAVVVLFSEPSLPASKDCNKNIVPDECEVFGDLDEDVDVDLRDMSEVLSCYTGDGELAVGACLCLDTDGDDDVDVVDFQVWVTGMTGPSS